MTLGRQNKRLKLTSIGAAFAIVSALETGLVVAQWTAKESDRKVVEVCQSWTADAQAAQATCSARPSTLP
jgi:hypothetical protein